MDMNLSGQHVLITGGSKGIGLACAQAFLSEGAKVTLLARQSQRLQAACAQLACDHDPKRIAGLSVDLSVGSAASEAMGAD